MDTEGWISVTHGGQTGSATRIDQHKGIRLEDTVTPILEARAAISERKGEEGGHYASTDVSGARRHDHRGQTHPAGREVFGYLDLVQFDGAYGFPVHEAEGVGMRARVGAMYWRFGSGFKTSDGLSPSVEEARQFSAFVPLDGFVLKTEILPKASAG